MWSAGPPLKLIDLPGIDSRGSLDDSPVSGQLLPISRASNLLGPDATATFSLIVTFDPFCYRQYAISKVLIILL